jgi:hypothetical protein
MLRRVLLPTLFLAAALVVLEATTSAQSRVRPSPAPPPLPVFEWNQCPFEGCTYRQWKAEGHVVLYSTWKKSRRQIGELAAGDKVVAVTGVVITYQPGVVRIDRDAPSGLADVEDYKRGDTILTYSYHGEGELTAWYKGHFYDSFFLPDTNDLLHDGCPATGCPATYVDHGEKEWWAKVKLRSGRTAWVWMDHATFDGVDALGS